MSIVTVEWRTWSYLAIVVTRSHFFFFFKINLYPGLTGRRPRPDTDTQTSATVVNESVVRPPP